MRENYLFFFLPGKEASSLLCIRLNDLISRDRIDFFSFFLVKRLSFVNLSPVFFFNSKLLIQSNPSTSKNEEKRH